MSSRDLGSLCLYVAVAFGLSWLIALPLWVGEGLASPWFGPISIAIMVTPALAALAAVLLVDRPAHPVRALGLWPLTPVRRFLSYLALGLVVPIALVLVALPVGALLGVYDLDLQHFSAFREVIAAQAAAAGVPPPAVPILVLVIAQLVSIPVGAVVNLLPALGEELGWRGWLLPKLLPLGTIPALLISGAIWGLWHAPLVLLGYNYPTAPGWLALALMTGMCILVGAVFGWLRLRSASVWPAALAHGAFNAAAGVSLLLAAAGSPVDTTQATVLGWSGWIVPMLLVVVLVLTGQFRPAAPAAPRPTG